MIVTSLRRTAYFDLALAIADLLGVGGKEYAPPVSFLPRLARSDLSPLLFSFTRCISPPWIFDFNGFSAESDMETHSRDPFQS